jgi:ABC-2 type transport system ATP-binding protein
VLTVSDPDDIPEAEALLRKTGAEVFVDHNARRLTAPAEGLADLTRVVAWFDESGIAVDDLGLARPSLDDVFLSLTGHRAEDASAPEEEQSA